MAENFQVISDVIKYQYVNKKRTWIKAYYFLATLFWISVLVGYFKFLQISWYLVLLFLVPILIKAVYHFIGYLTTAIGYKGFDHKEHEDLLRAQKKSLTTKAAPTVDVYIPVAGEELEVVGRTIVASTKLDYPKNKFKIFVLDDGGSDDVRAIAASHNVEYIRRPNLGEDKKAGNLKYALSQTKGEYYVVFDADFVPHKSFLQETMPYMLADEKLSIVQTPQYFERTERIRKKSSIAFGSALIQEVFYQAIMPARDRLNGAICVGTNALYRRSAVMEVGGPVLVQHSEDVNMGLELNKVGYKIKYLPLILAIGLAPTDIYTYYRQQHRWATGATLILTRRKLLTAKIPFMQKILYLSGVLYYFNNLATLVMPLQFYFLIAFHYDSLNIIYAAYFIPSIVFIITQLWVVRGQRPTIALYKTIAVTIYAHSQAIWNALRGKIIPWTPTNNKTIAVSKEFIALHYFSAAYLFVSVLFIAYAVVTNRLFPLEWRVANAWFWLAFSLILIHLSYFMQSFNYIHKQYLASYVNGFARRRELAQIRAKILYAPVAIVALLFIGGLALYQNPASAFRIDKQARGGNVPAAYDVTIKSQENRYNSVAVQAIRPLTKEMSIELDKAEEMYASLRVYQQLDNKQPAGKNRVDSAVVYSAVIESQRVDQTTLDVIEASQESDRIAANNAKEADKPEVASAKTEATPQAPKTVDNISIAVMKGDNQTSITRKVLADYAKQNGITVSYVQIKSIEDSVINEMGRKETIHPGETLVFSKQLIQAKLQPFVTPAVK